MSLWTCMRHWFDNQAGWALIIPIFPDPSPRSHWPGHHTPLFLRPLRGPSVIHHVFVWLEIVIITALWAWSWSLPIRARNYEACPLCSPVPGHPGTCSPGLVLRTHHHHTSSDGLSVVTTPIVCPLNPPSQLAGSRHPATSCLSTLDIYPS